MRFKGRVGVIEDPPELVGKFAYTITVHSLDGSEQYGEPITRGPFDTEKEAQRSMRDHIRYGCDEAQRVVGKEPDGKYIDLVNGDVERSWDEH